MPPPMINLLSRLINFDFCILEPFILKNKYGEKFRTIRQNRNKSLRMISSNITSKSSLDRWEQGQDNLSFNQVLLLLNKLNIRPDELIENGLSEETIQTIREIETAYINDDTAYLLKICNKQDEQILSEQDFLKVALACNCYLELTGKNVFTKINQRRLTNYFYKIENWYYEDIMNFGNTAQLLDSSVIFRISSNIINYVKYAELSDKDNYRIIFNTLLNASYNLLKLDTNLAEKLISRFNIDLIPQKYAFERIRYNFMLMLFKYLKDHDDSQIKYELNFLKMNKLDLLYDTLEYAFEQIKVES